MMLPPYTPVLVPMPWPVEAKLPEAPQPPKAVPLLQAVQQLGSQTKVDSQGLVQFDEPLIKSLVAYKADLIEPLGVFLTQAKTTSQVVEGLYTAQRLAQSGVADAKKLYSQTMRFQTETDPLVQIYLAGFYRAIDEPATFGPLLRTFLRQSLMPTQSYSTALNPIEEVGGTLLQKLAEKAAEETVNRLKVSSLPNLSLDNQV